MVGGAMSAFLGSFADGRAADVCVVGGAGHVGLPLAIVLADRGLNVMILDPNQKALGTIAAGKVPFVEHGAEPILRKVLAEQRFVLTPD